MEKTSGSKKRDKNKVVLPPELPPEVDDDEVDPTEEGIAFYAADTLHRLRRAAPYDGRVAGLDEERQKRKAMESSGMPREDEDEDEGDLEADPVDALPIKTLVQGELVYNRSKPFVSPVVNSVMSEDSTSSVKTKAQESGADAKQSIKKDEQKGKSKNKKGDDNKVKNTLSQTEVPKEKLHANVAGQAGGTPSYNFTPLPDHNIYNNDINATAQQQNTRIKQQFILQTIREEGNFKIVSNNNRDKEIVDNNSNKGAMDFRNAEMHEPENITLWPMLEGKPDISELMNKAASEPLEFVKHNDVMCPVHKPGSTMFEFAHKIRLNKLDSHYPELMFYYDRFLSEVKRHQEVETHPKTTSGVQTI